jgi:hypothetical protein
MIKLIYLENTELLINLMSEMSVFIQNKYIFYTIEIITLGAIIFVSKRYSIGKEVLDVTAKLLGSAAAITVLYNNWGKGSVTGQDNNNSPNSGSSKDNKNINNENNNDKPNN